MIFDNFATTVQRQSVRKSDGLIQVRPNLYLDTARPWMSERLPFDCLKDISPYCSYNPSSSGSESVTEPSGDEDEDERARVPVGNGGAKRKAGGGTHAKPEDIVLLFDLLARLDPKGVSELS